MRILDVDGTVLRDRRPRQGDRATEIDRGEFRDLLLGPRVVRWGRAVTPGAVRSVDAAKGRGAWESIRSRLAS